VTSSIFQRQPTGTQPGVGAHEETHSDDDWDKNAWDKREGHAFRRSTGKTCAQEKTKGKH